MASIYNQKIIIRFEVTKNFFKENSVCILNFFVSKYIFMYNKTIHLKKINVTLCS